MALPESAVAFMRGQMERVRRMSGRKKIVFPEGSDPRVLEAAARLAREGLAQPILIGRPPAGAPAGFSYVCSKDSPRTEKYAALFYERRRATGVRKSVV